MSRLAITGLAAIICLFTSCSSQKTKEEAAATPKESGAPAAESAGAKPENTQLEQRIRSQRMQGDLDEIFQRRFLRVLVVPDRLGFFFDGAQMQGAVFETMTEFERLLNKQYNKTKLPVQVVFVPVHRNQVLEMLADGRGDIAAARIAVTDEAKKKVDLADPIFDNAKGVLVTGPGAPAVSKVEDLAGKQIHVVQGAQVELLAPLNAELKQKGLPEIRVNFLDENLSVDDILEMVNAGLVPMTVAEVNIAQIWNKVFTDLRVHEDIVMARGSLAWALRKGTPKLMAAVNDFMKDHKVGTAYGSTVARRYFKDAKWVKNATSSEEVAKFNQMVQHFRKHGSDHNFPYLLAAAQGYQESRLNQSLKSPVGAIGVMQVKPSTAAGHPINIPDISTADNNIKAGVKYMRFLVDEYYKDEPMDPINKGLFAIASYNAGPNKIKRLRQEAKDSGFDENKWFNNVEVIVSRRVGRETTQYVANIYKYYLAYKMVTDAAAAQAGAKAALKKAK